MIGAKNFIGNLIDQWLQKWSNCKILSWDSLKPQKETFQERIFKSTQRFLFWMILTLWRKSCPIWKKGFEICKMFSKHYFKCGLIRQTVSDFEKLCMNLKVIAMKLPKESYALQCNGMQVSNKPQVKADCESNLWNPAPISAASAQCSSTRELNQKIRKFSNPER